jgi:hypothetical protein
MRAGRPSGGGGGAGGSGGRMRWASGTRGGDRVAADPWSNTLQPRGRVARFGCTLGRSMTNAVILASYSMCLIEFLKKKAISLENYFKTDAVYQSFPAAYYQFRNKPSLFYKHNTYVDTYIHMSTYLYEYMHMHLVSEHLQKIRSTDFHIHEVNMRFASTNLVNKGVVINTTPSSTSSSSERT